MSEKIELTLQEAKDKLILSVEGESFTFDQFMSRLIELGHEDSFGQGYKGGLQRGYPIGYAEGSRDRDKDN